MSETSKPDFVVVGAGPAGAAFAYYATSEGYSVEVYEGVNFASKPCGWAVPLQVERYIRVPNEVILTTINGFRIYIDGKLVHESSGQRWGYILDKPKFIESLLENATVNRRFVDISDPSRPRVKGEPLFARERVVLAPGLVGLPGYANDTILAVQQIFKTSEPMDTDIIEIWFDSNLVGYYWVFPRSDRTVDIGVGGYEDAESLRSRLEKFVETRFKGLEPLTPVKGARINVSGANTSLLLREVPIIGEAAGFVYPLTGEGIRPSIASAYALFNNITRGDDVSKHLGSITRWINLQLKLLNKIRTASPEIRANILAALPIDVFTSLGLGELSPRQLLRLLPRLPKGVASILRVLIS